MDFLGLTTLTLIDDALKMIEKRHGVQARARRSAARRSRRPTRSSAKAFTSGVFQFESPGMRDILRRYQPTRIEDLTALNALYRPGPMAA
jgi:DNA polymerase III subunit alpha